MSYVNAGHTTSILRGSASGQQLRDGGPPLGLFPSTEFQVGKLAMESGDMIFLYSDGITEAGIHQGEEFGESRLEEIIAAHGNKPLAEIQEQVLTAVHKWSGDEPEDDMTILIARAT